MNTHHTPMKTSSLIDAPQIVQTAAQHTALIHLVIPKDQIQELMGPGIEELMSTVGSQGIQIIGPWFTHHNRMSPDQWDFEISVPVASPIKAAGRVKPGTWPAMKMVRTHYRGPFEQLGEAWGEFDGWTEANKINTDDELWEVYLVGPESGPDSSKWTTQLSRRVIA